MTVDVVVVTHNSADHVGAALDTLLGPATGRAGDEPAAPPGSPPGSAPGLVASVVVVDNASTDATVERARRPGVMVVANPDNRGFGAGADQGAAAGHAPYVLFLNPDARLTPGDLDLLVGAMEADPALALVSPRLDHPDGSPQQVWWPFPSAAASWREAFGLHRLPGGTGPARPDEGFVIGACLLARRSTFEALGGFDPRFWLYAEETDLARRALDAGGRVAVVDRARAVHVGGASGEGVEGLVFEHFHRGAELYVDKHDGTAALVSLRLASLTGASLRGMVLRDPARRAAHRARARRLVRLLLTAPTTVPRDRPTGSTGSTGGAELVVCSMEAWDDVWRRNQFLVRELLAHDPALRILFVEPPFDRVHQLRHRAGTRRRGRRPIDGSRLVAFQPTKVWPRVLGPWADRSLRRQVQRAARAEGFARPTLWINDPSAAGLMTATGWPALYDMTDDWLEAAAGPRARARLEADEGVLFARAGAVTVCSPGLAASRAGVRPDLELVPNAVDRDHLTRPRSRPADLPAGPTAVYVGTLHDDRLDVELVVALARALGSTGSVVLVGPDALTPAARGRLDDAGVHRLGPRPYADVPAYLQHATVVIVPHVVTPFTESLDPIKAYECLALGRPTVATPVAGFRDLGPPVTVAGPGAFVATVQARLADPAPDAPAPVAGWDERAASLAAALDRARAERAGTPIEAVIIDHCAELSGAELALVRLVPALDGVRAHVVLGEPGPLEAALTAAGATVEVLPLDRRVRETRRDEVRAGALGLSRAIAAGTDVLALRRRLRQLRPDLVHTNSLKAALYGGAAARLAGVPVVWHVRDRIAADYLPGPVVVAVRALSRVVPQAVIVNSQATLDSLGRAGRAGRATLVWDAVEPPVAGPPPPSGSFRVAMIGRLSPWKGQDLFLEAFARAFPDGPETAVLAGTAMFGEDDYARSLAELVDHLGLAERVTFAGFVDDVPGLLESVHAVVHASTIAEPFGQVVIEGMASGRPVIAAAAGGPLEIITDEVDGLLFPTGDRGALARQLTRLARDPELAGRLGRAARTRALDFSPARTGAAVTAVYRRVLGRPEPRP